MHFQREDYDNFIKQLKIINTTFPICNWHLHYYPPKKSKLENSVNYEALEFIFSKDKTTVIIPAKLEVIGKVENKKKNFFEITLIQHLEIKIPKDTFSEELLEAYVYRNALLSMIAVFREHVKYATFQMGLPPLILPALKILPFDHPKNTQTK